MTYLDTLRARLPMYQCPRCGGDFQLVDPPHPSENAGALRCGQGHTFPVLNGIPRFVPTEGYAASFGYQWNRFARIQLDSYNNTGFSAERLRTITGWSPEELRGKQVLDAGCGAGRFAEVVGGYGAELTAVDLSSAVDACRESLKGMLNVQVCQGSIYELPFKEGSFDYVYCIGVIQHTPDPMASIRALCRMVKPGGKIGLWIYERDWKSYLGTLGFKEVLRPMVSRWNREAQVSFAQSVTDLCYPVIAAARPLGVVGKAMMRLLPAASAHIQQLPLRNDDFKTWVFLDTLDTYSPAYDTPQTYEAVAGVLAEAGYDQIQRHPHGGVSITGRRVG